MKSKTLFIYLVLALSLGAVMACGDDDDDTTKAGEGTVTVTAYGESFIEEGISADEMDDGWAITFDRFVVEFDEVKVGGVEIDDLRDSVDLAQPSDGSGHVLGSHAFPAGTHAAPSFAVENIQLSGSATKEGVTKTFAWTFDADTHYTDCDTTTTVTAGESSTFEITIHADHLFSNSLVSHNPLLGFQALADADTDGDGEITQAELEAADLGSYDPGSDGHVDNLWKFLSAQSTSLGHVDGEGHCATHSHDHDHDHAH